MKETQWFLQHNQSGQQFWDTYMHPDCTLMYSEIFHGDYTPFNPPIKEAAHDNS